MKFKRSDGFWDASAHVPVFGSTLTVHIMCENDVSPTPRQKEVLNSLENLPRGLVREITKFAIDYYQRIDDAVDLAYEGRAIKKRDIAKHYTIKSILIPNMGDCDTNYFFISADCTWEEEHGMQILVEDGQVRYCGDHTTLAFSHHWDTLIATHREQRGELLAGILDGIE